MSEEEHYYFERYRMKDVSEVYKGDGINNCKWCGDTGWMHTFLIDGTLLSDAPCCCCEKGRKILHDAIVKEHKVKMLAYVAQFVDDEWCTLVHGETRGKAKSKFFELYGDNLFTWEEIRVRRLPGCDDKPFTYENCKAAGFEYMDEEEPLPEEYFTNDCNCYLCKENK